MRDLIIKKGFKLSIIGAIGMLLFYEILLSGIIHIPFFIISGNQYFMFHQLYQDLLLVFGDIITYIIILKLIFRRIRKKSDIKYKLKIYGKFNHKLLLCTLFLAIGYFLWFQSSIGIEVQKIPIPKFMLKALEEVSINPYYLSITAVLVAPIYEEIFFRGIFLEGFLNKYKPSTAIIVSALIFGLAHLNIPQFINAGFLGIIIGVVYFKTRSLILCICTHMLNNSMAFLLVYLGFSPNVISFFIGIIIFITAGRFFIKNIKIISENKEQTDIGSTI